MIQGRCRLQTVIAALQVERYRIENGRWPDKLEHATGQVPIDARGQAIRYQKNAEGILLYSIGGNAIDEQGFGQQDYDQQHGYDEPDDFAVRLYNPELRNALPPPDKAIEEFDELFDDLGTFHQDRHNNEPATEEEEHADNEPAEE